MKTSELDTEIQKTEQYLHKLLKEYTALSSELFSEITNYTQKYSKNNLSYVLSLPKDEQVLILRDLHPVVNEILIEMDAYKTSIGEYSKYLESLRLEQSGVVNFNKKSRPNSFLN